MKVKELIEALSHLDPNMDVVKNGYEGGYRDIQGLGLIKLICDVNTEWYYGPHEEEDDYYREQYPNAETKLAVNIG